MPMNSIDDIESIFRDKMQELREEIDNIEDLFTDMFEDDLWTEEDNMGDVRESVLKARAILCEMLHILD